MKTCLLAGVGMMQQANVNPYLHQIERVLPRVLALYDQNPISPTLGLGDRYFWAWKLIDFGNASFQGAAHGLSRLVVNDLLPEGIESEAIIKRILRLCRAVRYLRGKNGSVGEAFPNESSFCVTALVAYDLLSALEVLGNRISRSDFSEIIDVVAPLISFLHRSDESHALISNHLATAAVALFKFHALTGQESSLARGGIFLDRILSNQSGEGWYKEYEGADPGYQSLCTYYLADLHRLRPDIELLDSLTRSIKFIGHFAHLDGSFGGVYGSRNTRFYYPSGFEMLRNEIPEAGRLADFMRQSILSQSVVTLETMDEPNLVPMFNSYCLAAQYFREVASSDYKLPCHNQNLGTVNFPDAGLVVRGDPISYTVISTKKGGVCYHFSRDNRSDTSIDTGAVYRAHNGDIFTSQAMQHHNEVSLTKEKIEIRSTLVRMNHSMPSPIKFILLRLLNVTLMRNLAISDFIKKCLVWLLINRKQKSTVINHRVISFQDGISIQDNLPEGSQKRWTKIKVDEPFSTLHMASQGYWQKQDDYK